MRRLRGHHEDSHDLGCRKEPSDAHGTTAVRPPAYLVHHDRRYAGTTEQFRATPLQTDRRRLRPSPRLRLAGELDCLAGRTDPGRSSGRRAAQPSGAGPPLRRKRGDLPRTPGWCGDGGADRRRCRADPPDAALQRRLPRPVAPAAAAGTSVPPSLAHRLLPETPIHESPDPWGPCARMRAIFRRLPNPLHFRGPCFCPQPANGPAPSGSPF